MALPACRRALADGIAALETDALFQLLMALLVFLYRVGHVLDGISSVVLTMGCGSNPMGACAGNRT